ncbi:MAG: hypothetical protein JOZ24_10595 [Candidatus Eremiobacteraeota bacterium]|nr:hypothetical protein [Candidatus Eremiobacteraeota bacterium]
MNLDALRRAAAGATLAAAIPAAALAGDAGAPVGGHFNQCHGYVRHVSDTNIRVHCIDGKPADLSFLYAPNFATLMKSGKSVQTKDLKPGTPVHVIFTDVLGVRKAYKIYVADPRGHGLYGFQS